MARGMADGMVSGACHTTADTMRPALQVIGTKHMIPSLCLAPSECAQALKQHVVAVFSSYNIRHDFLYSHLLSLLSNTIVNSVSVTGIKFLHKGHTVCNVSRSNGALRPFRVFVRYCLCTGQYVCRRAAIGVPASVPVDAASAIPSGNPPANDDNLTRKGLKGSRESLGGFMEIRALKLTRRGHVWQPLARIDIAKCHLEVKKRRTHLPVFVTHSLPLARNGI
eukprot:scaffold150011_cov19-Prasinocladus_malaysianus.AAC.1